MRLLAIPFLLLVLASGCISPEAKRQAVINEAAWNRFAALMDQGKTTRDQEQAFIRAEAAHATAMRANLGLKEMK